MIYFSLTTLRCFDNGHVGKQPVAWKEYCAEYWLKELQESMNSCTGRCDITEILLKMELNTLQSIYLSFHMTFMVLIDQNVGLRLRWKIKIKVKEKLLFQFMWLEW